jgi:hypothetical protein
LNAFIEFAPQRLKGLPRLVRLRKTSSFSGMAASLREPYPVTFQRLRGGEAEFLVAKSDSIRRCHCPLPSGWSFRAGLLVLNGDPAGTPPRPQLGETRGPTGWGFPGWANEGKRAEWEAQAFEPEKFPDPEKRLKV